MQKKALLFIIAITLLLAPAVALAQSDSVSSNDLIDRAKDYDGTTVVYEGEVLGDILYRKDHAWLAVFDGSNTIGVYVSAEQAEEISIVGGYGKKGDTIRVEGVFNRACAEHGGDLDIHAESVTVLTPGASVPMPATKLVRTLAIALPLPAALLLLLVWKKRAASRPSAQKSVNNASQK